MEKLIDIQNSKIVIILDSGSITDIFLSPALEGLEIQIIDHDKNPQKTSHKEQIFNQLNESLMNVANWISRPNLHRHPPQ